MAAKELQIPILYQSQNAQIRSHRPQMEKLQEAACVLRDIGLVTTAQNDQVKILLLLIDPQIDFCHPGGSLFVAGPGGYGAVQDCMRTANFIYRNTHWLTRIAATQDTHHPFQIFFPEFWLLKNGRVPNANTLIQQVDGQLCNVLPDQTIIGQVRPNPAVVSYVGASCYEWLIEHVNHYVDALAEGGQHSLYLWPHHCLQGSDGHRLSGLIEEAMLYHSFARQVPPQIVEKGTHPLTESYSVFRPEVRYTVNHMPLNPQSDNFIVSVVEGYDAVIIAGQASSHCVAASVRDLVCYCTFESYRQSLLGKFYLLTDCMSPVVIPSGPNFSQAAEKALADFEQAGMHLVNSTTPLNEWPDFPQVR